MKTLTLTSMLTLSIILMSNISSVNAQSAPQGGSPQGYNPQQQQRSAPDITAKDRKKFKKVRKDVNKLNQKFDKKLQNVDASDQDKVRKVYGQHQEKLQKKVEGSGLSVEKYNYMVKQQRSQGGGMGQ